MSTIEDTKKPLVRAKRKPRQALIVQGQPQHALMGATEAALALGVKQSNLRELSGLPKPFQVLAMGSVWLADDIIRFRDHRKLHPPTPGPKPRPTQKAKVVATG
jgi:hypothetical protein